jgi:hypothetical protein
MQVEIVYFLTIDVPSRLLVHNQSSNIYLKMEIRCVRKEKEANVQNINSILSDLS